MGVPERGRIRVRIAGITALALLAPVLGCSFSIVGLDGDPEAALGEAFVLAPGQEVRVAGTPLEVGFHGVNADSRCPVDVRCVWAGDAAVEVETTLGGEARTHVLHTSPDAGIGPRVVERGGYRLELVGLEPEPHSERPIRPLDYRATLRVVRLEGSWS